MTKIKNKYIYEVRLRLLKSKSDEVIKKIVIKLKEILNESPDFTGDIHLNFFMGGLANINKTESLKIK